MSKATVLIVDDEKNTREGLRAGLEDQFDIYIAADREGALQALQSDSIEVMVTDLRLGGDDGMQLIDEVLALPSPPACIMMTAYGSVDTAVEAIKRGAYDFVAKPLNIDELEILIKRALQSRKKSAGTSSPSKKKKPAKKGALKKLIGNSPPIHSLIADIEQVAPSRATVLLQGESGTGKELAAQVIHQLSKRRDKEMVTVHCAALSPQLLESELFGHEKGAFTGAQKTRIGRFEQAQGGTLFLDEIGEIDASTQVKLLRALGEQKIERVGGNESIDINVRIIAATNKNLEEMVKSGKFREDLFYRLHVVRLTMPPLRERPEDIPALASHFLKIIADENNSEGKKLSKESLHTLKGHSWQGNIRELRSALEHSFIMGSGNEISPSDLPSYLQNNQLSPSIAVETNQNSAEQQLGTTAAPSPEPLQPIENLNIAQTEATLITKALERSDGNRTEAAKLLGISRRTLQRKLKNKAAKPDK